MRVRGLITSSIAVIELAAVRRSEAPMCSIIFDTNLTGCLMNNERRPSASLVELNLSSFDTVLVHIGLGRVCF